MSMIKTSLMLYDGMTGPLKNITTAMNVMINAFEAAQSASHNAIDTKSLQTAREQIAKANVAFGQMEAGIQKNTAAQKRFNNALQQGHSGAEQLLSSLKNAAIVAAGVKAIKFAVQTSDTVTNTTSRLNFLVEDGGSVEGLEAQIMESAQRSRGSYLDTANAVASMGANAKSAFSGNDELIAFMEQVNKQFVIGGASAQGQAAAMLQLQQAMAAGALRGEELNSILENAPGIARTIESYMGVAEGSIKKYAEQGQITAEVVKNALLSAADETNAKFEQMPMTFAQIWQNVKNQALDAFRPILAQINQIANSKQFQEFVSHLLSGMQTVASVLSTILEGVINVVNFLSDLGVMEPIIYGLVAAFVAWKVITIILTAAQMGLNAALLTCPITWIILAVAALAVGIIWLANKVGGFGVLWQYTLAAMQVGWSVASNTVLSGIDWMVYGFMWLYDKGCWVWDSLRIAFMQAWGGIATTFETILSGFLNGMESMVNWAIDMLNGLIKAYDIVASIWGGQTNFQIEHTDFGQEYQSWAVKQQAQRDKDIATAQRAQEQGSIHRQSDLIDQANKAKDRFNKGLTDAAAAWSAADAYAEQERKRKETEEAASGAATSSATAYDNLYANVQDINDNTTKMADSLSVSETELKYLREIAERQAINKFTTAEIKLEMHNTNTISGDQDIDGIIEEIQVRATEALVHASEGVHI